MTALSNGILFIGFFFFFFSSFAFALDEQSFFDHAFTENGEWNVAEAGPLADATVQFNALPPEIQSLFNNQRVEIDYTRSNGIVEKLGIVVNDKAVDSITRHPPANPTLIVQSDSGTVEKILSSPNPPDAILNAVAEDKIKYSSTDFFTSILLWFSKASAWILHTVNGLFHG